MEIKTDRLYIGNLQPDDWMDMKKIFTDFTSSKYSIYDWPLPTEDSKVKEVTEQFVNSGLFFTVHLLDSDEMIGYVCFHVSEGKYDLGYCFHSLYHSKGYAFEAAKALILYLNKECNVKIFISGTALANTPSCRLLKRLGFHLVKVETASFYEGSSFEGGSFILEFK